MKNKLKIILTALLLIITFVLVSKNQNINLEILKNTNLNDKDKIEKIIKSLDYGKKLKNYNISNNMLEITYDIENSKYQDLEKNASILFYLIDDLKEVNYKINEDSYSFNYDKISLIYGEEFNISSINERYKNKKFEHLYLGNIKGYADLFDNSDLCITDYIEIYRDSDFIYYMTCSSVDDIVVLIDNKEYKLIEAIEDEKINIDDLFDINIKMKKEGINNDENID